MSSSSDRTPTPGRAFRVPGLGQKIPIPLRLPALVLILWACLGLIGGCGPETALQETVPQETVPQEGQPTEVPGPQLSVEGAQAQLMGDLGAVYFRVINRGSAPDRLVRIETPAAESAETHESLAEDGVVRMRARPDGFEIPAGGTLTLEPGGKHVMLLGLDAAVTASGRLPLRLVFEGAPPIEIEIETTVGTDGQDGAAHHHD